VAASLLAAFAAVRPAGAEEVAQRSFVVERSDSALLVSVGFHDLFDEHGRQKLDSGFWNRVVVRVNTRAVGQDQPVALAARTCRVRREVWEELYEVQLEDHTGRSTKRLGTAQQAIAHCAALRRFPVAGMEALGQGRHTVEVIAELNPMSQELVEEVRRWIRSPQGSQRRLGQGSNFFGSVVSIFVNPSIGRSDRMLMFRSQVFSPAHVQALRSPP
jgi:hypothetical protein